MDLCELHSLVHKIIENDLNYQYYESGKMVGASPLLEEYENKYYGIRPKHASAVIEDNKVVIYYTSYHPVKHRHIRGMILKALRMRGIKYSRQISIKTNSYYG